MSNESAVEPARTADRLTASETKSLEVVVSAPARVTVEPVATTAVPDSQATPPADVND
jgi:hypothetical protein